MRGTRDGAAAPVVPKYALIERERRWRVDPARRPALTDDGVLIEDRYITGTRLRLRRMASAAGMIHKLTKKYPSADSLARPIVTAYLDAEEYAVFAALAAAPLVKRRHPVTADGLRFSVDRFEGPLAGLELAEIERPDAASLIAIAPPAWLTHDVSHDPRYDGASLAYHGLPKD